MSEEEVKTIEVPVNVHLVQDPSGRLTTTKKENDVDDMFEQVNQIWESASIEFTKNSIETLTIGIKQLFSILFPPNIIPSRNPVELYYVNNFQGWMQLTNNKIHRGTNGFSRAPLRLVCVRDEPKQPVTNQRCLAHEFGHILISSEHPEESNRLMSSAQDGIELSDSEIEISRAIAESFIN